MTLFTRIVVGSVMTAHILTVRSTYCGARPMDTSGPIKKLMKIRPDKILPASTAAQRWLDDMVI
jgi:hypothetical protein